MCTSRSLGVIISRRNYMRFLRGNSQLHLYSKCGLYYDILLMLSVYGAPESEAVLLLHAKFAFNCRNRTLALETLRRFAFCSSIRQKTSQMSLTWKKSVKLMPFILQWWFYAAHGRDTFVKKLQFLLWRRSPAITSKNYHFKKLAKVSENKDDTYSNNNINSNEDKFCTRVPHSDPFYTAWYTTWLRLILLVQLLYVREGWIPHYYSINSNLWHGS